jgi:hypothetical protein
MRVVCRRFRHRTWPERVSPVADRSHCGEHSGARVLHDDAQRRHCGSKHVTLVATLSSGIHLCSSTVLGCWIRGARRGANGDRRRATQADPGRRLTQLDGSSGHGWRHEATTRLRLVSGRSAVRIRSPAPRRHQGLTTTSTRHCLRRQHPVAHRPGPHELPPAARKSWCGRQAIVALWPGDGSSRAAQ